MNPRKCAFGVTSGKFLRFIVRQRGIEIDQSKIEAIQKMPEPKNLRELRGLQGKLAYIRRFISNLAGWCQPFHRLMKKDVHFEWDEACSNAFACIKRYLLNSPVLGAPIPRKPLVLYIAAQENSRCSYGVRKWKGERKSPLLSKLNSQWGWIKLFSYWKDVSCSFLCHRQTGALHVSIYSPFDGKGGAD